MSRWQQIDQHLSNALGVDFKTTNSQAVGGGCINEAFIISNNESAFFIKLNTADLEPMFAAEAAGLDEIIASHSVHAPKPVCWGHTDSQSYLVMEALKLGAPVNTGTDASALLGQQLAQMHQKSAPAFGWTMDNTIGSTAQPNTSNADWQDFYAHTRLGFQLQLAKNKGCGQALIHKGERLIENISAFFTGYSLVPSLLHGDLWSGNYAIMTSGLPVIFDPAVYYGDREADLAMTELFGGFNQNFYQAYNEAWPLDAGYPARKTLYNLYHILNHYNLFGGGYGNQAENMLDQLLSEIN